jgi:hypothetical protein
MVAEDMVRVVRAACDHKSPKEKTLSCHPYDTGMVRL